MIRVLPFLVIYFTCKFTFCQEAENLIQNGNFETYSACNDDISQYYLAEGWSAGTQTPTPYQTPDFYTLCGHVGTATYLPNTGYGYEYPIGTACMGMYCTVFKYEYIDTKLITKLKIGKKYRVTYSLSQGEGYNNKARYSFNHYGFSLSTKPFALIHDEVCNKQPYFRQEEQFYNEDWQEFTHEFIADSNYQYICFGMMIENTSDYQMELITLGADNYGCFAYLDNISLVCVDDDCDASPSVQLPNVFTPNNDGVNDEFVAISASMDIESYRIEIYNRWGNVLFTSDDILEGWNGSVNDTEVAGGVYFYRIVLTSKNNPDVEYLQHGFFHLE